MLHQLSKSLPGRFFLKIITAPFISKMAGAFMNSSLSKPCIDFFIKKNNIDMSEYKKENWESFNEFFTRKLKNGKRNPVMQENILISPCDSFLSVYEINDESKFLIKDSLYTVSELCKNEEIENEYSGGICLVFRLTPTDYHRYIYPDSGAKGKNTYIQGKLNTVRPQMLGVTPVYKTNSREYTILRTNNFDNIVFMEVGALLVGKIKNYHEEYNFKKGEEKGLFEFGGSTIIMLLKKDIALIDSDLIEATNSGQETRVKLGEKIGVRK